MYVTQYKGFDELFHTVKKHEHKKKKHIQRVTMRIMMMM
jgi:hypothetical protein